MPDLLTVKDVAKELGVSASRVHALIRDGRLPARKMGVQLFIKPGDVSKVKTRKPGRPPGRKRR